MSKLLGLLVCIGFIACRQQLATNEDKQTQIFQHYLSTAFHDSLRADPQVYILIPRNSCKGCLYAQLKKIKSELVQYTNTPSQGIIAWETIPDSSLKNICPSKIDSLDFMDRINLPIGGITLIYTNQKKVIELRPIR
jgi:hypothetical protein